MRGLGRGSLNVMQSTFAERLAAASSLACVGLDPVLERLPDKLVRASATPCGAVRDFCLGVIEAVAETGVAAVKPQLACFERYGASGFAAYQAVAEAARDAGLLVVADAKRGDIGLSARHYAAAFLNPESPARGDAVTVNPYLGSETLEPFWGEAASSGGAVFTLVRTSNAGGDEFQAVEQGGRTVAQRVADVLQAAATQPELRGCIGAVVGATRPEAAAALRRRMPDVLFLVPGYGAQGGGLDAVRACLDSRGGGALITASRSVLYPDDAGRKRWERAVREAAEQMVEELAGVGS